MLCLQAYNSTADRLQLIPATAKRAEGAPFEAQVERTGAAASEIVSLDLKGAVKPALIRLRCGLISGRTSWRVLVHCLQLIFTCALKLNAKVSTPCSNVQMAQISMQMMQQEETAVMMVIHGRSKSTP